jgi:hypothetical protein
MHFFFRYLASGNSFKSMGYSYRISPRAISRSVMQVCEALWRRLKDEVMPEPTKDQLIGVANDFSSKWNFNNCIGAIDGKHVHIKAPPCSGSDYFNYKGRFSTVLLAIADSHMIFIYVLFYTNKRTSHPTDPTYNFSNNSISNQPTAFLHPTKHERPNPNSFRATATSHYHTRR